MCSRAGARADPRASFAQQKVNGRPLSRAPSRDQCLRLDRRTLFSGSLRVDTEEAPYAMTIEEECAKQFNEYRLHAYTTTRTPEK